MVGAGVSMEEIFMPGFAKFRESTRWRRQLRSVICPLDTVGAVEPAGGGNTFPMA